MKLSFRQMDHMILLIIAPISGSLFFPLSDDFFATFVLELELLMVDALEPCMALYGKLQT